MGAGGSPGSTPPAPVDADEAALVKSSTMTASLGVRGAPRRGGR